MYPISLPNSSGVYSDKRDENHSTFNSGTAFLFVNQMTRGYLQRGIDKIRRRPTRLEDLNSRLQGQPVLGSHYLGLRSIEIDRIHGSEGRKNDFDRSFHPVHDRTQSRWLSVARARLAGKELPPIELIQIGEEYFVRDGHHRISVAQALGENYMDARITKFEVEPVRQKQRLS